MVTTGHCGNVGDHVKVNGDDIGQVSWKSTISDLLIIEVPPLSERIHVCYIAPYGPHCIFSHRITPRAIGQVLTYNLRAGGLGGVPITNFRDGVPDSVANFCTSVITTDVNCTWSKYQLPTHLITYAGEHGAITAGTPIALGDSGCPVYTPDGLVYGVHTSNYGITRPGVMTYISAGEFMVETNDRYDLAPTSNT